MIRAEAMKQLSGGSASERLAALEALVREHAQEIREVPFTDEVNNHVHTVYSFSPYSPTLAALMARLAGLRAVGSVDHDSIGAAREMVAACKLLSIGSTVGCELRVNFSGTRVEGRRLNNPDSLNIAYMVIHGVPEARIDEVAAFLSPLQRLRNQRNRAQVERLNELTRCAGIDPIDFDADVAAFSSTAEGGSITERHILAALARLVLSLHQAGDDLIAFLQSAMNLPVPGKIAAQLSDVSNPHRLYDLLGVFKSSFLDRIFIQPDERECISVFSAVEFANSIGAIPAYAYLGDVGESPTGDKKAEKYEDDFLDELVPELSRIGYRSITYMPPRNTVAQLLRVQALCAANGLLEISGVDINSSRQSFRCPEIMQPEFSHLNDTTWALIAHEKLSACDPRYGLFAKGNPLATRPLPERVTRYAGAGRNMDPAHPESICAEIQSLQQ